MANLNCLTHDTADGKEHTYRINGCDRYFIYKEDVYPLSNTPAIYPNSSDLKTLPDPVNSVFDLRFSDVDEAKCFFEAFDYFPREFEYMLYHDLVAAGGDRRFNDTFVLKTLSISGEAPECIALVKDRRTNMFAAIPCDSTSVYGDDDDHDKVTSMKLDPSTRVTVSDSVIAYQTEDHKDIILEGYEYDEITKNYTDVKAIRHIADADAITRISDFHYTSTGDLTKMLLYVMQCVNSKNNVATFLEFKNINGVSHEDEQMDLVVFNTKNTHYAMCVFHANPDDEFITLTEAYVYENMKDIEKMFR